MYLRQRPILCFFALLLFWMAAGLWLVLSALQSESEAQERSMRAGMEALALSGNAGQDWTGLLLDSSGRVLLAQPADLLDGVGSAEDYAAMLLWAAVGTTQGWLDIEGVQGRFRRAYFSRTGQGQAWVALPPCRRLDPLCSAEPVWIGAAALGFLATLGWAVAWLARALRAVDGGRLPQVPGEVAWGERMHAIGRLSVVFAHELNNQFGIISNSAYLVQRIDDARLALPAQALLRAVESASALTQRLQRYGERGRARPRSLDLCDWLPRLQPALALALGKRMELGMGVAPQAMHVQLDPEAFELALSCVMLGVRDALAEGAVVRLTAALLDEAAEDGLAPGRHVQICVEAWAAWPQGRPLPWQEPSPTEDARQEHELLRLAKALCRGLGAEVRARSESGRCMMVALVLPMGDGAALPPASA